MAVEDLLRASDDPEEIMKVLEEEFGHPTLLLECAMNKVRTLPRVTDSGREIRTFTAVVRNCVSLLKAVRADGYLNNPQIVNDILHKLTPYQRAQYGDFIMKKDSTSNVDLRVSPSLELMVEFLGQLSRASVYYAPMNQLALPPTNVPAGRSREQQKFRPVPHKIMTQAEAAPPREHQDARPSTHTEAAVKDCKCILCNLPHQLPQCEQFLKMDTKDRWKLIKDNKMCFKCITQRHLRKFCKAKRCDRCRWQHHTLLHEEKPAAEKSTAPATQETTEAVTILSGERSSALLKVLPVTIIDDNGRETPTYALLDDGATVSVVDESCAGGVGGLVVPLRLVTAGGNIVEDHQSRKVKVTLRGTNGKCHVVSVRTLRNAELPTHTLPAAVLEANPHLRDLDCEAMEGVRPKLLLGQDNWELIVGTEFRQGKAGKPVASLTRLGWVVHGPVGAFSSPTETVNCLQVTDADLHSLVKAQFELEAIGEQWPGAEPEGVQSVEEADGGETAHINVVAEQAPPLIDATRHSTWARAQRVMARVLAFTRVCRGGRIAAITAEDLRDAELRLLMQAQTASFAAELGALRAGRALPANSSLRALDPIIYEDGLLRVRGRLSAAPNLSIDERHDHLGRS
ncbi:hypothetical protein NE865_16445 [Phthorimaea operculella]|nr:hypothetical protein NE865_16445 [Phthorimaea operculella]